jgi:hypothetical protein
MKVFIVCINSQPHNEVWTSLKQLCGDNWISYSSASRGKRIFIIERESRQDILTITEARVLKIKGRDNNAKRK